MQLHQLKPKHKLKEKKRIARGGKRGTYAGRGIKGQKSRAGKKFAPVIRGLIKKYPKLRGYRNNAPDKNRVVVNLEVLNREFNDSEVVSPKNLLEKKIISKIKGKLPKVKILARGEIGKSLNIKDCELSKNARDKIGKAKGKII
jgi:large subunit ribosomal protein L15